MRILVRRGFWLGIPACSEKTVCARDGALEPTGMYSRRVFELCAGIKPGGRSRDKEQQNKKTGGQGLPFRYRRKRSAYLRIPSTCSSISTPVDPAPGLQFMPEPASFGVVLPSVPARSAPPGSLPP